MYSTHCVLSSYFSHPKSYTMCSQERKRHFVQNFFDANIIYLFYYSKISHLFGSIEFDPCTFFTFKGSSLIPTFFCFFWKKRVFLRRIFQKSKSTLVHSFLMCTFWRAKSTQYTIPSNGSWLNHCYVSSLYCDYYVSKIGFGKLCQ